MDAPSRRPWFQFRPSTILTLTILAAVVCWWGRQEYQASQPLDWQPYSQAAFEERLLSGQTVVLFFDAGWDCQAALMRKVTWTDPEVKRLIRARRMAIFRIDLSDISDVPPEYSAAADDSGCRATACTAIYRERSLAAEPVYGPTMPAKMRLHLR